MHKFKIGARLFPTRLDVREGAYVVIKRLPMRDGEFEYQIKSVHVGRDPSHYRTPHV
jgi:hypothetical protein